MKHYEQTDHLGNCVGPYSSPKRSIRDSHPVRNDTGVIVVHTDKRIAGTNGQGQGQVLSYRAEVVTVTEYYPFFAAPSICDSEWLAMRTQSEVVKDDALPLVLTINLDNRVEVGMGMMGRSVTAEGYRYAFNGQEKEKEITGSESHTSAEYWMYDSRLGRRWNVDPVVKPHRSGYDALNNNPILHVDVRGDNDFVYDQKGNVITEIKTDEVDRHFMLQEHGEYIYSKTGSSDQPVLRVLSRESITQDPRDIERGWTSGFNGVLDETYTFDCQQEIAHDGIKTIHGYYDIVRESDNGSLEYGKILAKGGVLFNLNGIYMNRHEALNFLWGMSMSEIDKQGLTAHGVSIYLALDGADLYNMYDYYWNERSKTPENQPNHNEAIVRGYLQNDDCMPSECDDIDFETEYVLNEYYYER